MITTPKEYYSYLHRIQDENPPSLAVLLPSEERIYEIDLNARKIESPEWLSVETDHHAETIYFKTNRFFDNMDLTNTVCLIQYFNADNEGRIYVVPFYDITTYSKEDLILFPWCIEGQATKSAGKIKYSVVFYKLAENGIDFLYRLNTLEATSQILHGMEVLEENEDYNFPAEVIEQVYARIDAIDEFDIYWIDVD